MNTKYVAFPILLFLILLPVLSGCGSNPGSILTPPPDEQAIYNSFEHATESAPGNPVSKPGAFPKFGGVPTLVHVFDDGSFDPDGEIVKWEWNFSDQDEGQGGWQDYTETGGDAWHMFYHPGMKVVHLRVTDNDGNKDTAFVKIDLSRWLNANPVVVMKVEPLEGEMPLEVSFSAEGSYDPDGEIVKYEWDFGEGYFIDYSDTGGEAVYTYTSAGNYTTILRITDDDGAVSTDSREVVVDPVSPWVHTWGGSADDDAASVAVDDAGNIYLTGTTSSYGAGGSDVLTIMYDPGGNVVWTRTWGGSNNDRAYANAIFGNDSIYVAGDTCSYTAGGRDIFILKYSISGDLIWAKTWGGSEDEVGHEFSLAVDAYGDVYLAGDTRSCGSGSTDIILIKLNNEGDIIWQTTWGDGGIDQAPTALAIDDNGYVYLACRYRESSSADNDTVLLKYTLSGTLLWQKRWGGTGHDYAKDITLDNEGNVYVTGNSKGSFGIGSDELILYKYDSDGNLGWRQTWGGSNYDSGDAIAFDGNDSLYVGGITLSYGSGLGDLVLLKYSLEGELLQQKIWGEGEQDAIFDLEFDDYGKLYIAGKAGNKFNEWQEVAGQVSSQSGHVESVNGIGTLPPIDFISREGIVTAPVGVVDTGGGGTDALIIRIDPTTF